MLRGQRSFLVDSLSIRTELCSTRVGTKVMLPIFFSETIILAIMKFIYTDSASFTKVRLFFHKLFLIFNTLFPTLREMLCASDLKPPCSSDGYFHASCVTAQQKGRPRSTDFGGRGTKKMGWRVLNRDCRGMRENSPVASASLVHTHVGGPAFSCRRSKRFIFPLCPNSPISLL
jgi:hypothetical protein